jgi:hypothetical protein
MIRPPAVVPFLVAGAALPWLPAPARADLLPPPRYRYVTHVYQFDGVAAYRKDYRFFLVVRDDDTKYLEAQPVGASGEVQGKAIPASGATNDNAAVPGGQFEAYPLCLYAVPKSLAPRDGAEPRREWFAATPPTGVLRSAPLLPVLRRVEADKATGAADPLYRTRYRVGVVATPAKGKTPATKNLRVTLVRTGWVANDAGEGAAVGYLLGVPALAALGLTRRARPAAR